MTTLETQLQALAASAGIDKSKRPKGQPSLLHDPQTAADIDAHAVYETAVKGAYYFIISGSPQFANFVWYRAVVPSDCPPSDCLQLCMRTRLGSTT